MRFFFLFLAFIFCLPVWSQFGVRIKYNSNNFSDYNNIPLSPDSDAFPVSLEIGLDYWLRMNNYRVEFLPEISYERSTDNILGGADGTFSALSFIVNGNIYFMDIQGDCDCPTFSKEGGMVSKGIHLILSPGISKYSFQASGFDKGGNLNWNAGIGIGMDIGINDLITATPFVMFRYRPGLEWKALSDVVSDGDIDSSANHFQIGIRLGFRVDYQKPRFGN